MSMHKKPLTDDERAGLEAHGLPIGKPSQLSDCFRSGVAWAGQRIAQLEADCAAHKAAEEAQIALRQKADEREATLEVHLEQLNYVIVDAKRCAAVLAFPSNYNAADYQSFAKDVMSNIEALSKQDPATYLASRYKIKQAEALEKTQTELYEFPASAGMAIIEHVGDKAAELRQQAEAAQ